jgi:cytochrome c oxidase subunit 2
MTPVALDSVGPFAQPLTDLSWLLIAAMTGVLVLVLAATLVAASGRGRLRRFVGQPWFVVAAGLALPALVLSVLLAWSLNVTATIASRPEAGDLRIRVIGEMWWWRVHYFDGDRFMFETANEIHIPVGRPVAFELQSNDVIHAFWVPQLGGKMDMIPGRTNVIRLQADSAGAYRGQCAEYCGAAHALMALQVVAAEPAEYEAWTARQSQTAASAQGPGWERFSASGCGACHTVRGTSANGQIGPDLSGLGARRMIAAGILPNDPATLRRFIRHAGDMKPGVRMPDYDRLSDADVDLIASWLESRT